MLLWITNVGTAAAESRSRLPDGSAFDDYGELQALINARRSRQRKQLLQLAAAVAGVINDGQQT